MEEREADLMVTEEGKAHWISLERLDDKTRE